jgi:hypothetical protein
VPEPSVEANPQAQDDKQGAYPTEEKPEKARKTRRRIKIEKIVQLIEVRVHDDNGEIALEPVIGRKVILPGFESASLWVHVDVKINGRYRVTEETTGGACCGLQKSQKDACRETLRTLQAKFSNLSEFLAFIEQRRAALAEIRKDHDRDDNQVDEEAPREPTEEAPGAEDETGRTESHGDERSESGKGKPKVRPGSSTSVPLRKPRPESRKKTELPAWRRDPVVCPGEGYKWTRAGWRKISQRDKDAAVRREARIRANAWKYDQTVNPGEQFYWVNGYSYNRTLKDGTVKRINVRGHWRRRPARTQQFAKAA